MVAWWVTRQGRYARKLRSRLILHRGVGCSTSDGRQTASSRTWRRNLGGGRSRPVEAGAVDHRMGTLDACVISWRCASRPLSWRVEYLCLNLLGGWCICKIGT